MKLLYAIPLAAAILSASATTAIAHHSVAAYQNNAERTLTGSVLETDWSFPHVYIQFIGQMSDSEETEEWLVEADNPAMLRRLGLNRDTLQPGDVVTLTVRPPADSGNRIAFLVAIDRGDETVLDMRDGVRILTSPHGMDAVADSLNGVWAPILEPRGPPTNSTTFELTEEGRAVAADAASLPLPSSDCAPTPIPMLMFNPAFVSIRIHSDTVEIASEAQGMLRSVRLDTTNHANQELSLFGDSIGRWEGDVLVVDTINFAPHPYGHAIGVPSSSSKHLTERFALNADGKTLTYTVESEDSAYLEDVTERVAQWEYRPDLEFDQPICKAG